MAFYEIVFIARQDVSTQQVETLTESLKAILEENGAKIHKIENWGLRSLTYRIKKNRKGHYVLIETDGPWKAVEEAERSLRFNEDVLRYMTIRNDALSTDQSPILSQRGERGDRGDRGDREGRGERTESGGNETAKSEGAS